MLEGMFGSAGQRALEGRLAALIASRDALAQDVANIDTPGYQGGTTSAFASDLQAAITTQLGGTSPDQNAGGPGLVAAVPAAAIPGVAGTASGLTPLAAGSALPVPATGAAAGGQSGVVTPDGNGMDFNALMVQLAKTDLDYQAVSRQLQLTYQNLSTAIDSSAGSGS
jgi:flagellar basal body rod protein FlgB